MNNKPTVASFFAGVGGIDIGFEKAGFDIIFANEIDKYATKTYRTNFPKVKHLEGDIALIDPDNIPEVDVIVGGFPCQAFSIAGYRKGFDDQRGVLFFDLMRIVEQKKPKVIFAENVRNLVSHDKGKTFEVMMETLTYLGYHYKYKTINTMDYTRLPQNRDRVYVVAFDNKEMMEKFEFPEKTNQSHNIEEYIDFDKKVDKKYYYDRFPKIIGEFEKINPQKNTVYQWRRHYVRENKKGVSPTLTANMGTGGHNVPLIKSFDGLRKLTPRECFDLQGFPKNFILPHINDSQLYKQAGNSVSVDVVQKIAEKIKEVLT
jgi:DNA (cytosine-5)-methyltransferase 1